MLGFKELLDVLIPRYCMVCGKAVFEEYEAYFCIPCYGKLPLFPFEIGGKSPIIKTFWGRYEVRYGGSYMMYQSGSRYSEIFKEIKYRDRPELGSYLGYVYGSFLKRNYAIEMAEIDFLVPVPLSKMKEYSRGYNQAEHIAIGISNATGIALNTKVLRRVKSRKSQTTQSRFERWLNVYSNYESIGLPQEVKHIAIIDDVLTTGSTVGACIESIIRLNQVKISVFTLGYTYS
jgi:ComF family protein